MTQGPRRSSARRRPSAPRRPSPADMWRRPGALPDVEPIAIADEVGAILRSLGDAPPITGGVAIAHYATAVVERAAAIAAALALSAGVLAPPPD